MTNPTCTKPRFAASPDRSLVRSYRSTISKRDRAPLGRFGDSILGACGLGDWVVDDEDAYIARARAAVADPHALAALRAGLRNRLKASALGDEAGYARDFAAALRGMWRAYCA